ncbi:acidic leucine-rich nuclear phosphoprotein 32-related protein 1 [Dendrobium catenatum]|uniref:Acidic leucine-rich nuclear phosphoprotein 32-related protein 1 n=1 Tax=Dendrobium catenatum TaxID=906689 RepID=A0A2I0XA63_9ASPA|nr:acidic leucine-rich nuclear phosphoprotein 32-related protein 1 [Dendrobium catenatum]PKU84784.1 Acidic leucine-rich nuclear phosphoprotein 32-related protein 1 [Dendrobium catenatum]
MSKANSWMDDAWERVVEAAVDGQATRSSDIRVLNLDGAVKSLHGCLPPAGILERFPSLEHLSIANVGVLSLEKFPRLRKLQRLSLSDNRIAGGLENLVQAGLHSLRDLDLSNNRIQYIEDLAPLAKLHLVSLDLYECPVTRVNDYRSKVFSMIGTLKYLDNLDANEDERPETDDDDDDEEEEEDEEEEAEEEDYDYDDFDPGSGEVDGDDRAGKLVNGCGDFSDVDDVIVDADEDEESDADEEEMETSGRGSVNGFSLGPGRHLSNGFRVAAVGVVSVDGNENDADEDVEVEDDDDDLGEEIDEEGDDTDLVHKVLGSDEDDEDGVDDVEDNEVDIEEEDDDDEEDLEDDDGVDVDEYEVGVEDEEDTEPGSLARFEEEIDGHEHGEEDENEEIDLHDENGEIGWEDELVVDDRDIGEDFDDGEDEDDLGGDYLVQPIARPIGPSSQSDFNVDSEEEYLDPVDDSQQDNIMQPALYNSNKRRRDDEGDLDDGDNLEELRLSKRH